MLVFAEQGWLLVEDFFQHVSDQALIEMIEAQQIFGMANFVELLSSILSQNMCKVLCKAVVSNLWGFVEQKKFKRERATSIVLFSVFSWDILSFILYFNFYSSVLYLFNSAFHFIQLILELSLAWTEYSFNTAHCEHNPPQQSERSRSLFMGSWCSLEISFRIKFRIIR